MIKNASLQNMDELLEREKKLREALKNLSKLQEHIAVIQKTFGQARIGQTEMERLKTKKAK
jgi:hypothetical protein